ncbi:C2 domain-containing protein [Aureococcus anophagefferens]|nr:C2 domain-containing protein [Aureococcus anophagefferens]
MEANLGGDELPDVEGQVSRFGVEGALRLKLGPLTTGLPCASLLRYGFLRKPTLTINSEFGVHEAVTALPVGISLGAIDRFIQRLLDDVIAARLCWPARATVDLATLFLGPDRALDVLPEESARDASHPIGQLRVEIASCASLLNNDVGGKSDPYVVCTLGATKRTTTTIHDDCDPAWEHPATFLFGAHEEPGAPRRRLRLGRQLQHVRGRAPGVVAVPMSALYDAGDGAGPWSSRCPWTAPSDGKLKAYHATRTPEPSFVTLRAMLDLDDEPDRGAAGARAAKPRAPRAGHVETLSLSSVKHIIRNAVGSASRASSPRRRRRCFVLDGVDYEFSPGKNGGLSFLLSEALYCDRAAGGPPCFEAHLVLTKAQVNAALESATISVGRPRREKLVFKVGSAVVQRQDLNDAPLTDKLKALPLHGVVAVTFADEGRPRGALAGALFFEILEEDRTRAPSILSRDPTMPALVVHFTRLDAPLTFQVSVATLGRIFSDSQLEKLDAKRSLLSQAFGVADASAAQRMLPNPCTFVCACCPRSNHTVSVVLGGATGPETPSFFDQADVHKLSSPNNLNKVIQHTAIHLKQAQDAKEVVPVGDADGVRDAQKKIDGFDLGV